MSPYGGRICKRCNVHSTHERVIETNCCRIHAHLENELLHKRHVSSFNFTGDRSFRRIVHHRFLHSGSLVPTVALSLNVSAVNSRVCNDSAISNPL